MHVPFTIDLRAVAWDDYRRIGLCVNARSYCGDECVLKSLRIRGPFRGLSGYDHHTREFTRAIAALGVEVELVDFREWGSVRLPYTQLDPWFDRLNRPVDSDLTLHFTMPHQVVSDGCSLDINFTMFEATRVRDTWIRENQQHHLVIVPTVSSRDAWLASGLPADKVRICPLGVDPDRFNPDTRPLELTLADGTEVSGIRTRFLNVSELGPRKNITGLLRAWMLATRADDDTILIIKPGRVSHAGLDGLRCAVRNLEHELGRSLESAARVELLFGQVSDRLIPSLYTAATHYISMSHGEGWDNAMIEAAASGLRLIAPDHSAYRAYLNDEIAWMVPAREVPALMPEAPDLQGLFQGANWWEPDVEHAAGLIRTIIDGEAGDRNDARAEVASRFRWEQSAATLLEILDGARPAQNG